MPNSRMLRRQLDQTLRTDADLDAFCLDYFPDVFRRFGTQMERTQKVNLLLQLVPDHRQILRQLPLGAAAPSGLAFSPSAFAPLLGTGAVLLLVLVVGLWPRLLPPPAAPRDAIHTLHSEGGGTKSVLAPPVTGMAYIRGGDFVMGSSPAEVQHALGLCQGNSDSCPPSLFTAEQPQRSIVISDFYLDVTEVTNTAYAAWLDAQLALPAGRDSVRFHPEKSQLILGAEARVDGAGAFNGLLFAASGQIVRVTTRPGWGNRPVVQISWQAAQRYCAAYGKRLPTEAEWEYAARSGSRRIFPWGSTAPSCTGVAFGRSPGGLCQGAEHTASVATMPLDVSPAPESVHDLGGNVAEWVMDWYLPTYPACIPPCRNPVVTAPDRTLPARVVRGGDAQGRAVDTRAARRAWLPPSDAKSNVGFRCAMDAPAH